METVNFAKELDKKELDTSLKIENDVSKFSDETLKRMEEDLNKNEHKA